MMPNQNKVFYFFGIFALTLWSVIFYQGYTTAVNVWIVSEIFNHCLFVLPFSLFLIYRKKTQLNIADVKPSFLPLIPLACTIFVQLFAAVGDIKILMHIATFTSLPLLIWLAVGNKIAQTLAFPLFFMIFCIPIGDQLIPHLQELTTDIAVPLLELTNVPIYRNGLYLDIPEGRFLVAEACSGISFLISSVVFGFGYAYLSFASNKKRALFVAVSILVPIIANAIRVYGIILTGHLSDMKYAVGADHLIYGGVFYTFVLFLLIVIGERYRDKSPSKITETSDNRASSKLSSYRSLPVISFIVLALIHQAWLLNITRANEVTFSIPENIKAEPLPYITYQDRFWQPQMQGADKEAYSRIELPHSLPTVEAYIAYYDGTGDELISSSHRLFSDKYWSLLGNENVQLNNSVKLTEIASQASERRYLLHWYEIGGKHFNSANKAKLYQAYLMLLGKNAGGVKVILTATKEQANPLVLIDTVKKQIPEIRATLYQSLAQ